MLSYEVFMGLSLMGVVVLAGSLNREDNLHPVLGAEIAERVEVFHFRVID
jgi:NADH:ubiquinone oxidoreductase subunit H